MNEGKYAIGTLGTLEKRKLASLVLSLPGAVVSSRVRQTAKSVFLDKINDGGLLMVNEILLRMAKGGIYNTLRLMSDPDRHPIAFYCTAGKDRTGIITAIILLTLGIPPASIIRDYCLSNDVYSQMDDSSAMVGALTQRDLDPATFLSAPPEVMQMTIDSIRESFGGIEGYLDIIGFRREEREGLMRALMRDDGGGI